MWTERGVTYTPFNESDLLEDSNGGTWRKVKRVAQTSEGILQIFTPNEEYNPPLRVGFPRELYPLLRK